LTSSATAKETLEAYFKKIGGRPEKKEKKSRKRKTNDIETPKSSSKGRKRNKTATSTPEPTSTSRKKKDVEWKPPTGSWENHILNIDTIEELRDEATGELHRHGYVVWKEGTKSRHTLATLNAQAPQKVRTHRKLADVIMLTRIDIDVAILRIASVRLACSSNHIHITNSCQGVSTTRRRNGKWQRCQRR
jgi:hypothetical protein